MLHCVKAHTQSQREAQILTLILILNSAHSATSWTSTPVPNFIAIPLRGACNQTPNMWNITICDFLLPCPVLSCPGYTFFSQSRPARTPGQILTVYDLNDVSSPKDVPFVGFNDDPQF